MLDKENKSSKELPLCMLVTLGSLGSLILFDKNQFKYNDKLQKQPNSQAQWV